MTTHRSERVRVLAVTADPSFASSCERHLGEHDSLTVTTAGTVGEAIERLAGDRGVDCIVSDHDLPDTDGLAFLESVRTKSPMLPFVLFTSEGTEEIASHAISADVTEYLVKGRHDDQWDQLATLVVDAVDYHRSQQGLFDPETRATTLLDAANDMISVVRDGQCKYVNATGLDLLALDDRGQAADRPIESWLSPPDGRDLTASLAAVQSGDQPVEQFEATLTTSEDRELSVEVTATRVRWSDGPATVLVVRDIDERRADEQMLRQFQRAVEAAGHAIYMTDPDGTITYVNPAFEEMTGYDSDDVLGKTPAILSSGTMSEEYYEDLWSTITSGDVWEEEIRDRRQSGALYYAHQTIAPLTDDDGEVVSYVAIQNDTTEQRRRESQLRQYEHAIEGASELIAAVDYQQRNGALAGQTDRDRRRRHTPVRRRRATRERRHTRPPRREPGRVNSSGPETSGLVGRCDALQGDGVGGVAPPNVSLVERVANVAPRGEHLAFEFVVDALSGPGAAIDVLEPLEVRHRDAARVREDVGNHGERAVGEDLVCGAGRRSVGTLDDEVGPHVGGVLGRQDVAERGRNEHVDVEFE
ncbi:PAS domain S-box protein (plasmid) [Halomicrobium mukohataei]|uniref:PAS domain S-box protein n=1 Tax=Halomicrobium mukohataei TaxID=57705 RepID=A0A4D6KJ54_9EURY|nr:PAS domain S-box protein [Halomicrobium mukohataei]